LPYENCSTTLNPNWLTQLIYPQSKEIRPVKSFPSALTGAQNEEKIGLRNSE
jgi:hypothetical protein